MASLGSLPLIYSVGKWVTQEKFRIQNENLENFSEWNIVAGSWGGCRDQDEGNWLGSQFGPIKRPDYRFARNKSKLIFANSTPPTNSTTYVLYFQFRVLILYGIWIWLKKMKELSQKNHGNTKTINCWKWVAFQNYPFLLNHVFAEYY